jgi:hypothetical protein
VPENIFVVEQDFREDVHIIESKGKKFIKIPLDWNAESVRVYPAKLKLEPHGNPSIHSVVKNKAGNLVVLSDKFEEKYAIVVKLRKANI